MDNAESKPDEMRLRSNVRVTKWKEPPAIAEAAPARRHIERKRKNSGLVCVLVITVALVSFMVVIVGKMRYQLNPSSEISDADLGGKLERCDLSSYPRRMLTELKVLDLSRCGNNLNLPDEPILWASFTSLRKLDLNNNQLSTLIQSIENIPSLEILFLSENEFKDIPEVIQKMKKLKLLSLRGNLITDLSTSNLPIATLEWLILTNNRIETVNSNINELKRLKKLMLSHNEISEIPDLSGCQDLELVRIADNNIHTAPISLLTQGKLAWISLSGNSWISKSTPKQGAKVISENELEIYEADVLGSGASGKVYKGSYQSRDVAIKMFRAASKGSDGNSEDEAYINSFIDTKYAISALGVIPATAGDHKYKGMVMELLEGTHPMGLVPSFQTVTRDEGAAPHASNLSNEQVMSTIWNIASALEYVHAQGICHGDVYLHNVLRDGEGVARLSDWGASFQYDRSNEKIASSIEKIEVLAFGRLVQDLFNWNLNVAVPDTTDLGSYLNTRSGNSIMNLVVSTLQPDQSKRPTFHEIKEKLKVIPEFESFRTLSESI